MSTPTRNADPFHERIFTRRDLVEVSGISEENIKAYMKRGLMGSDDEYYRGKGERFASKFDLTGLIRASWMRALSAHWAIPPSVGSMIAKELALNCAEKVRIRLGQRGPMIMCGRTLKTSYDCGHGRFDRFICVFFSLSEDGLVTSPFILHSATQSEVTDVAFHPENLGGSVLLFSEEFVWEKIVSPCLIHFEKSTGISLGGSEPAEWPGVAP